MSSVDRFVIRWRNLGSFLIVEEMRRRQGCVEPAGLWMPEVEQRTQQLDQHREVKRNGDKQNQTDEQQQRKGQRRQRK